MFDVLKKIQQTAYVSMNSMSQQARKSKYEREKQRLWCLPITIIAHSVGLLQERNFWRKDVIVMDREPNCDSALRVDFVLMCVFIHFCRAVSYITQMRFHHQLMRFHKTALVRQSAGITLGPTSAVEWYRKRLNDLWPWAWWKRESARQRKCHSSFHCSR